MGGKSKSSTQNTTTIDSSTRNFNQAGAEAAIAGNFNRVTLTDQGAVEKAFDFGGKSLVTVSQAVKDSLKLGSDTLGYGSEALGRAFEFGSESTDNAFNLSRDVVNSASADRRDALSQSVKLAEGARASADQQISKAFQFAQSAARPGNLEPFIVPATIVFTVIGVALIFKRAK